MLKREIDSVRSMVSMGVQNVSRAASVDINRKNEARIAAMNLDGAWAELRAAIAPIVGETSANSYVTQVKEYAIGTRYGGIRTEYGGKIGALQKRFPAESGMGVDLYKLPEWSVVELAMSSSGKKWSAIQPAAMDLAVEMSSVVDEKSLKASLLKFAKAL